MISDAQLIQFADASLANSYARAGDWMACKPGCHACCVGVFPITSLDAARLRRGLEDVHPVVAEKIRRRSSAAWERLRPEFPGDPVTGRLYTETTHEDAFEHFGNDEPCPVLNPVTRTCELYDSRPMPCRTFGPPMPNEEGGLAVCELCFVGAAETEVHRCAVDADFLSLESQAVADYENGIGESGLALIAFVLSHNPSVPARSSPECPVSKES